MYEAFYGLKEKPFSMIPDPEYLFLSTKHQRALTLLEYGMMNHAGFSVICGDTGAGKTTLIRRLLSEMGNDTVVGLITNTHQSFGDLLNWVLMAFGLDPENKSKAQMHQIFITYLVEQYAKNKRAVLIVDEAQNMTADTLEELRMLSNINADKDQVLQVILAGQPALRETLRLPELMQFAQRIAVDYYLEALNKEETATYIKHRLKVAGAERDIFTAEACAAIYHYSGGTPRLINLLCDTSLVYGFAEQTKIVDVNLVNDVVREQHSHSVVPTYRKQQPQSSGSQKLAYENDIYNENKNLKNKNIKTDNNKEKIIDEVVGHELKQAEVELNFDTSTLDVAAEAPENVGNDQVSEQADSYIEESNENLNIHMGGDEGIKPDGSIKIDNVDQNYEDDIFADKIETIKNSDIENKKNSESHYGYEGNHENRRINDLYPVVQVEEKRRSNINGVVIGFSSGLFLASILLVVFVFTYGIEGEIVAKNTMDKQIQTKPVISAVSSVDDDAMKKIQKEHDAILEANRILERERDAALAAARVQEEMRAAEKRAAEIIAEQERKAALEVRRAKERAKQAELDAVRAKERERLAFEKAELERMKAEKVRLEKELMQIENVENARKIESKTAGLSSVTSEKNVVVQDVSIINQKEKSNLVTEGKKRVIDQEKDGKFVRNPCDSPSAKFLSTCKK